MVNILDLIKGQLGSAAIGQIAELVGENNSTTSSAINSILPSLLGGLMQKGATTEGASGILDMLSKDNIDGSMFDNISGLLGGGSKTSALMNIGSIALPFILGGKKAGFMNLLSKATGLGGTSSSSLTNLLLPMILGMVGKQVKKGGLNPAGLMDLFGGQKEAVMSQLPAGMGDLLGLSKAAEPVKTTTHTQATRTVTEEKSSSSLMKWLPLLAILLGAGWFLTRDSGTTVEAPAIDKTVEPIKEVVEEAVKTTTTTAGEVIESTTTETVTTTEGTVKGTSMKYMVDAAGNLTNEAGDIILKNGDYKIVDGYYVDGSDKKLGKVWEQIKKVVQ